MVELWRTWKYGFAKMGFSCPLLTFVRLQGLAGCVGLRRRLNVGLVQWEGTPFRIPSKLRNPQDLFSIYLVKIQGELSRRVILWLTIGFHRK